MKEGLGEDRSDSIAYFDSCHVFPNRYYVSSGIAPCNNPRRDLNGRRIPATSDLSVASVERNSLRDWRK